MAKPTPDQIEPPADLFATEVADGDEPRQLTGTDGILQRLTTDPNVQTPTKTKLQAALKGIDVDGVRQAHRARMEYEVWDGTSVLHLNGRDWSADELKAHLRTRGDWPEGGRVYLGYMDGQLSILQPHPPIVEGLHAMDDDDVEAWAVNHLNGIADEHARAEVLQKVQAKL